MIYKRILKMVRALMIIIFTLPVFLPSNGIMRIDVAYADGSDEDDILLFLPVILSGKQKTDSGGSDGGDSDGSNNSIIGVWRWTSESYYDDYEESCESEDESNTGHSTTYFEISENLITGYAIFPDGKLYSTCEIEISINTAAKQITFLSDNDVLNYTLSGENIIFDSEDENPQCDEKTVWTKAGLSDIANEQGPNEANDGCFHYF